MRTTAKHDAVIVTAIIDLERKPGHNASLQEYVHLLRHVFDIGLPVVAYVEPRIANEVGALGGNHVHVVPAVLSTLPGYDAMLHDAITRTTASHGRPATSRDPIKDTADYLTLQLLKPHLVRDAAQRFPAERLWWIDAGIAHACHVPDDLGRTLTTIDIQDALVVRDLRPGPRPQAWTAADALGLASGGCFALRANATEWFARTYDVIVDAALSVDQVPSDEDVLTTMCIEHADRVTVRSGRHQNLLEALMPSARRTKVPSPRPVTPPRERALLPVQRIVDVGLPIAVEPRWSLFNPSVCLDEDGGLAMIVRSSNYRLVRSQYDIVDGGQTIRTRNAFVRLAHDLTVTHAQWIDDREVRVETPSYPVEGLEDARLFRHAAEWWLSAAYREHSDSGAIRQLVARIGDDASLTNSHLLASPVEPFDLAARLYEKNWMPMPSAEPDRLRYVWGVDPFVVVEADLLTNQVVPVGAPPRRVHAHALRGSSQVVDTPVGLIGIVHEVDEDLHHASRPSRAYVHRLIRIDGTQCHAGPAWVIEEPGLEFVAGLALRDDRLLISYGRDDATARIAECLWSDVIDLLPLVDTASPTSDTGLSR